MRRAIRTCACVIALAAWAAPVASARTLTFGADLNNPANVPNNDTTGGVCAAGVANPIAPIPGSVTPPALVPPGYQSCMWTYTGYDKYDLDGLGAPATGRITAIRVKVGPVTGKMRVNVIRFLNQRGSVSGPYLEAYGPEFTPKPNSITQVPTSLRVQSDDYVLPGDPTIRAIDQLALEVEAPDVPIPLFRDPPAANNFFTGAANTYGTYPGPTEQRIEAPSYNAIPGTVQYSNPNGGVASELGVLMSADLTTGSPGGASSAPPSRRRPRCIVPGLKGRTLSQAKRLLSDAHCALGKTYKPKAKLGKSIVASQSLKAGSSRPRGTKVNVKLGPARQRHRR